MENKQKRAAVILAAGKGTRMKSDLPKVAVRVADKPMLNYVIDSLLEAGVNHLVIIVGYKREEVIKLAENIKDAEVQFAFQEEQNGTAHALLCARDALKNFKGSIIVASGDMPLIRPQTIRNLFEEHEKQKNGATILSALMEDPTGYGRLVRSKTGLEEIIEEKDADENTKKIKEINTGTYVFETPEIFTVLSEIKTENAQKEYYLTDAVRLLRKRSIPVNAVIADDPDESLGANSMDDVKKIEEKLKAAAG